MSVRITGRHLEITSEISDYIEAKLPRIAKYSERLQQIDFVLEKDRYQHKAEVRMKAGPIEVTAKTQDPDLMRSIDLLMDKVERQLQKKFEKLRGNKKHVP